MSTTKTLKSSEINKNISSLKATKTLVSIDEKGQIFDQFLEKRDEVEEGETSKRR